MTENKRFIDDGFEAIEEQSFTDTKTDKTYYVDYFDEIIDLLNELNDEKTELKKENEQLKQFQEQVAEIIEGKMGDNVCNDYKMEVLKEIWNELELDEVWFK